VFSYSTPTFSYLIPQLPFCSLFLFWCLTLDFSTIFALAPHPVVLAETATTAVLTLAPSPLVLAEAAAAAVFAPVLLPLVLADAAAAAVFALDPLPPVLTDAAAAAVFALAPLPLVLADTAAATVFTRAPPPLVIADTAAAAVFARAPLPLMLADAAAAAVFAPALPPLVHAEAATTTVFALVPLPLVLAEAAAAAVFARAPLPLVHADAAAAAVFAPALPPLVLAEAAAAAVFTNTLLPLVLAEAAAAAVFAPAPPFLVLTERRGLVGLLGCRRMFCKSFGQTRFIGWVHTTLLVLAALSLWPLGCVPLQHSLLVRSGSLQAIRVIRHPVWRILHVEAHCAVGAVIPLPRGSSSPTVALFPNETILPSAERHGEAGRPRGSPTQAGLVRTMLASHFCSRSVNVSHVLSLLSSFRRSPTICQSRGTLPRDCQIV